MNGPPARPVPATVLIVDDTPANLAVLTECLEVHGYRVLVAQSGEEGVRRANFVKPDLILLDISMPDLDGFAACRRLKADPATREIPVIFMTALADTNSEVGGFAAGGVDFVTKPLRMAEVLARVGTHVTLSATRAALAKRNQQLQNEVAERQRLNDELECRVAERTRELEEALQQSRRLNADKETLLAEVHHRVKNNLQAICTLILLKSYQFQDPAVQQAFTDTLARVSAMRLVHEALYAQEGVAQVDFAVYLERLVSALSETYGLVKNVRFDITAEKVNLDLSTAVPVGLIAAEAIANAIKHAFSDGRGGRIGIDFRVTPSGKTLRVCDDGIGLAGGRPASSGTGTGLMETLTQQVDGRLEWSAPSVGTTVALTFP